MTLQTIGVIGAGTMGQGIAQIAAQHGHPVVVRDLSEEVLHKAEQKLTKILNRLVEKGRISEDEKTATLGRILWTTELKELEPCHMVIEAIVENLGIKAKVFSELEEIVDEDAILATNTSSLSVASIAASCKHSERCIGIHFFNPAPLMKLVEIIPAVQTSNTVLDKARKLIDSWGKITVAAKDTPGFIVNRVARPFYGEALRILEEGMADVATIDWAMTEIGGFRMGPFTLMDYIGNDINYTVTETVFAAFYYDPRYKPSFTQKRLSEAGYLGRKSGRGYYDYSEGALPLQANRDMEIGQAIVDRVLAMLINEAADAAFLNIASQKDIDLAMTKGVNYPKGLLAWANEIGITTCVQRMDALYDHYREDRYRCSPLLRRMSDQGLTFEV